MQTDRDWKTGCYNADCPGFVPCKDSFAGVPKPGMVIEELSSYGSTDSSVILQIVKVCDVDSQFLIMSLMNVH